jgi:uncharacterized protein YukE
MENEFADYKNKIKMILSRLNSQAEQMSSIEAGALVI